MMMNAFHRGGRRLLAAAALLATSVATPVAAQTLRLTDSSATTIRGGSYANSNFAYEPVLETRASSDPAYVRRIVVKFDTHNKLAQGTDISSAKLTLTVAGGNDETRQLSAYRGGESYDEVDATWSRRKDATYWSSPGGDKRELAARQSVSDTVGAKVTFDVTSIVQQIVNGTYSSTSRYARFLIVDEGSGTRGSYKKFYSDEAGDSTVRPVLTITLGSTTVQAPSTSDGDSSGDDSTTTTTTTTLKVLDWNIHHGVAMDGVYGIARHATFIASTGAHVVSLNEVERYTGWGNEDQPARFAALLKSKTGRTWYYQFAQRTGGSTGQGNLILSIYPFESTADHLLSYSRSVAQATIIVNNRRVNIFSTHLDHESSSRRSTQISELTRWASNFAEARVLAGDFNAWPGATEISKMTSGHYDVWAKAKADGTATSYSGNEAGNTRNSRIDYVWLSRAATTLVIKAARVFDARDSNGVKLSDHQPIMATFTVR